MYERFTDPSPHSLVTFSNTTKVGLGLPINKVMNKCKQARKKIKKRKRERVFLVGFSSGIVSSFGENELGNSIIVSSMGRLIDQPGLPFIKL